MTPNPRVLVSGASIAGPAVGYWLGRYGFDVTIVEKASAVRPGGQAVDFKGPVQMDMLHRMGILDAVQAADVRDEDAEIVDARGRRIGTVPGAFGAGEVNIPRGDLANILYRATEDTCEYVFGDSITGITETGDGVDVTFAHAAPRRFDIVIGADGMHSNVRRLVFGPEADYVSHLGYYYVLADVDTGGESVAYNEPGVMIMLGGTKAPAMLTFASPLLPPARDDIDLQKTQVTDALQHGRWRIPEVLAKLPGAKEFYMDSISRVHIDRWSSGRTVLLGDAAWGNALGGYGTGLALIGAYVLAGELLRARGDHTTAFSAFETKYRDYASVSQKVNAGKILAPRTATGIRLRNIAFTAMSRLPALMRLVDGPAADITLDGYDNAMLLGR